METYQMNATGDAQTAGGMQTMTNVTPSPTSTRPDWEQSERGSGHPNLVLSPPSLSGFKRRVTTPETPEQLGAPQDDEYMMLAPPSQAGFKRRVTLPDQTEDPNAVPQNAPEYHDESSSDGMMAHGDDSNPPAKDAGSSSEDWSDFAPAQSDHDFFNGDALAALPQLQDDPDSIVQNRAQQKLIKNAKLRDAKKQRKQAVIDRRKPAPVPAPEADDEDDLLKPPTQNQMARTRSIEILKEKQRRSQPRSKKQQPVEQCSSPVTMKWRTEPKTVQSDDDWAYANNKNKETRDYQSDGGVGGVGNPYRNPRTLADYEPKSQPAGHGGYVAAPQYYQRDPSPAPSTTSNYSIQSQPIMYQSTHDVYANAQQYVNPAPVQYQLVQPMIDQNGNVVNAPLSQPAFYNVPSNHSAQSVSPSPQYAAPPSPAFGAQQLTYGAQQLVQMGGRYYVTAPATSHPGSRSASPAPGIVAPKMQPQAFNLGGHPALAMADSNSSMHSLQGGVQGVHHHMQQGAHALQPGTHPALQQNVSSGSTGFMQQTGQAGNTGFMQQTGPAGNTGFMQQTGPAGNTGFMQSAPAGNTGFMPGVSVPRTSQPVAPRPSQPSVPRPSQPTLTHSGSVSSRPSGEISSMHRQMSSSRASGNIAMHGHQNEQTTQNAAPSNRNPASPPGIPPPGMPPVRQRQPPTNAPQRQQIRRGSVQNPNCMRPQGNTNSWRSSQKMKMPTPRMRQGLSRGYNSDSQLQNGRLSSVSMPRQRASRRPGRSNPKPRGQRNKPPSDPLSDAESVGSNVSMASQTSQATKSIVFNPKTIEIAQLKYGKKVKKYELFVKGLPKDVGIKDVKRSPDSLNLYALGHVQCVSMPMDKKSDEYLAFSDMKEKKIEPTNIRVPNRGFCFVLFKDYNSALNALWYLNSNGPPKKEYNGISAEWSKNTKLENKDGWSKNSRRKP